MLSWLVVVHWQWIVVLVRVPYKIASLSRVMKKENKNAKLIEMAMAEIFNPK